MIAGMSHRCLPAGPAHSRELRSSTIFGGAKYLGRYQIVFPISSPAPSSQDALSGGDLDATALIETLSREGPKGRYVLR